MSKKKVEEKVEVELMSWREAQRIMQAGGKVARQAFNEGVWVAWMAPVTYKADMINERTRRLIGEGVDLVCEEYYARWTESGTWQMGWTPNVVDREANDWYAVP
jgi:hypothetical protein